MNLYDIIKKPVITEKSELQRRENNVYTFIVDKRANKIEIRKAVESIFGVKVEEVNTLTVKPELKRYGMRVYKTKFVKKAMVKVKDGDKINLFPEV
ncbi:LSU ribosomal protein L23P [Hypnocyclicus thermotrophus]|uniref:Large ribosomal subunit protein uL23 n=1 Tax=Hypnocyclicus thermotrophus TaxID=1627895 RepID=A0AA46DZ12_9FUSO|nr:50S ribosomal protein L23 [Hypnocyclicus thermotrophus]TDT70677.1 LSU ribosomal protein L23P [Hypnocyclicus thermotrophus]